MHFWHGYSGDAQSLLQCWLAARFDKHSSGCSHCRIFLACIDDINKLCKRYKMKMLSYSEAMQLAILNGPVWARPLNKYFSRQVDIFLCIYHFGVDCVYVVFMGKNIKKLADLYFTPIDTRIYMALITVPLILTFLIRDLKYLVPFSIISNVLMLISFGLILSYFLNDLPSLSERTAIQSLSKYPLFFGTILFSIEAVGVILALQLHMTTPENYLGKFGVLNRAMIIVVIFYASFGFLGYWQFGDETSSSIINNLPTDETVPQCIIALFTIAIFFSYALQGYVTIEIIWRSYMTPRLMANALKSVEYLLRMAMVVASVLCAIAYPDFGLLLSFVGSFCLAQLGFIYPSLINIFVRYSEGYGPCKIFLLRSLFFIFIGLCGGIAGTMISVAAIREKYDNRILFFLSAFHITS
ncbi:proton-coupled amino acid transporter-like protein CG1139 isoform X4 [Drosophila novamexicana]|uniref:proton-coupled amino acid transporter-like protein CG1139 isoform X4 n=1 Tax=Drosophila novamexicana TaxID=47314 RepID=UPI0011E5F749|nr:proton-coupled amino acid transporter-like protein CG1139 isoform X4 [Drosophila novamexicana]XP_030571175.1 proton-coupled amino acid transporter-like protein CG1139 isoform X4 [Drosophila novamexicana]